MPQPKTQRSLRRAVAACFATTLAAATFLAVAPPSAADVAPTCPSGQTGVYLPPGTYPIVSLTPVGVTVPQRSIPLVTVHDPSGPTTFFLNLPGAFVGSTGTDVSVVVTNPGLGVCVAPGTPNVYLGLVTVAVAGSALPAAGSSGSLLVVGTDNIACSDLPLVVETLHLVAYEVAVDVRFCRYELALTPLI